MGNNNLQRSFTPTIQKGIVNYTRSQDTKYLTELVKEGFSCEDYATVFGTQPFPYSDLKPISDFVTEYLMRDMQWVYTLSTTDFGHILSNTRHGDPFYHSLDQYIIDTFDDNQFKQVDTRRYEGTREGVIDYLVFRMGVYLEPWNHRCFFEYKFILTLMERWSKDVQTSEEAERMARVLGFYKTGFQKYDKVLHREMYDKVTELQVNMWKIKNG